MNLRGLPHGLELNIITKIQFNTENSYDLYNSIFQGLLYSMRFKCINQSNFYKEFPGHLLQKDTCERDRERERIYMHVCEHQEGLGIYNLLLFNPISSGMEFCVDPLKKETTLYQDLRHMEQTICLPGGGGKSLK